MSVLHELPVSLRTIEAPGALPVRDTQHRGGPDSTTKESPTDHPSGGLVWPTVIWVVLLHVGAVASLFCFTWVGALTAVVLFWLTGSIGICMGYHRLFAHRSFKAHAAVRWCLAIIGTLGGEGSPLFWVASHRKHHQYSDEEGDPHSPKDGFWWSHVLWLFPRRDVHSETTFQRYAKDLLQDPFHRFMHATFIHWHLLLGLGMLAAGWAAWDVRTGISLVLMGMFLRLTCVLHVTWLVNSASHLWGYRNYETRDNSRNLWWVGLLAFGEGWHNNHHAFPRRARHGHRWWEYDLTYLTICLLERLGLVWDVNHGRAKR